MLDVAIAIVIVHQQDLNKDTVVRIHGMEVTGKTKGL